MPSVPVAPAAFAFGLAADLVLAFLVAFLVDFVAMLVLNSLNENYAAELHRCLLRLTSEQVDCHPDSNGNRKFVCLLRGDDQIWRFRLADGATRLPGRQNRGLVHPDSSA